MAAKVTPEFEAIPTPNDPHPDYIRVDGIVYDLHFTADGDYTFCVISRGIDRWYGGTVRSPKDAPDPERGRREAFKVAAEHMIWDDIHALSDVRRAYWKACQKIKEQK
jgi:hypothetical protein